ncbi:hypothetical protein [Ornithinimicrobium cavernae]|uniref:hypothetical protein n=1 Tax=Ornithinimicrobium cavernae TaxID=2666047 RepID=UPI000D68E07F|nr:hypothetical protein [Ornithinimicrobium cavernae]
MWWTQLFLLVALAACSLAPWWVAGRLTIPQRERLAWAEMDRATRVATLRRGATWWADARQGFDR